MLKGSMTGASYIKPLKMAGRAMMLANVALRQVPAASGTFIAPLRAADNF
jgi:hypothetical protein